MPAGGANEQVGFHITRVIRATYSEKLRAQRKLSGAVIVNSRRSLGHGQGPRWNNTVFLPFLSNIRVDSRYSWSSLFCRLNLFALVNWSRPTVRAGFTVRRIDVRLTYPRRSVFIRGLLSAR